MDNLERVEDAARLAKRIIDQIGETVLLEEHEITPGASIGIAVYPKDGMTAEHLIKDADAAMYRAKESGKNRYEFFTRDLTVRRWSVWGWRHRFSVPWEMRSLSSFISPRSPCHRGYRRH